MIPLVLLMLTACSALTPGGTADDIAVVRARFISSVLGSPPDAAQVRKLSDTLQPDGSWADVDYHSAERASWPTADHLRRVLLLTRAYRAPNNPLMNDPALGKAIHRALDYWLEQDFQCPNWWYNEISVPQVMGQILLLLGPETTTPEREKAVAVIMSRSSIRMTGQNRVWLSQNVFERGLLTGDETQVRQALDAILGEIQVTTSEGLQPDGSFHQHGPQQQFGNYGLAFAQTEAQWAAWVQGTSFALSPERRDALRDFQLNGEQWVVWRDRMDISGLGRQLYPQAQRNRGRSVAAVFRTLKTVDPASTGAYDRFLAYFAATPPVDNTLTGDRAFWRSDMLVHRTRTFYVSVRMSSTRVAINELVNSENLQGSTMGDGATYLYRRGDEYDDIFPVWDWRRLPGVTGYTDAPLPAFKTRNTGDFVGAVSDGTVGAAAMDFNREGLAGRKAWFCFDNGVACLGAGIHSDQEREVATTLNQCLLHGDVALQANGSVTTLATNTRRTFTNPQWVYHDGTGYLLLSPVMVTLCDQEQSGTWKRVIAHLSDATVMKPVFTLSIEHGRRPTNATYSYLILPDVDPERLAAYANHPEVRILSNTPSLQAVYSDTQHLMEAAFYAPGQVRVDARTMVTADKPYLLMLQRNDGGLKLSVADPTHKLDSLQVEITGKYTGENCRYDAATVRSLVTFTLPNGGEAGRTVVRSLQMAP